MKVLSYKYILPNEDGIVEGMDRAGYMTPQYIEMVEEYLDSVELEGRCAVLYAGGPLLTMEARTVNNKPENREPKNETTMVIKELAAFSMHRWVGRLKGRSNIEYASINGNTCASSMFSLYEAEQLLSSGFDQVFIIAEEKTAYNTIRVFDESNIELKLGEGLALIHLGKDGDDICSTKWRYQFSTNPFGVSNEGYASVVSDADFVNPHGTGTEHNEDAESIYGLPQLRYKEKYGHTMGVSGLLEVCLVLEENIQGDVLCVSSGLGGFYGSCVIRKP